MRIIEAHNHHLNPGGMEVLFANTVDLLREAGHEVFTFERSNHEIDGLVGRVRAFADGIYSEKSRRELGQLLRRVRPDLIHLHNVYPILSPSVLDACNDEGVPVVLACQDYTLTCPTRQHFRDGQPCHLCLPGKEYHCVRTNCRGSFPMSVGYALRSASARRSRAFHDGVTRFTACSHFVRGRLIEGGYPAERIDVLPNLGDMPVTAPSEGTPGYVAFIGRISQEKGVEVLLGAAALLPDIPFLIAGEGPEREALTSGKPANVRFVGSLPRAELSDFLRDAACLAVPSLFEEPFGIVAAEASGHGVPVVASRIGGLPEVVVDGTTGLLHEPGNSADLAQAISRIWYDPALRRRLGRNAREHAMGEFHRDIYRERLLTVFGAALGGSSTDDRLPVESPSLATST